MRSYVMPIEVLGPNKYRILVDMALYSKRYKKTTTAFAGFEMDGATGAQDILTRAWVHHDWLTASGLRKDMPGITCWDDGTSCTRWQSSMVLYDCLREDGYWMRAPFWCVVTWVAGIF